MFIPELTAFMLRTEERKWRHLYFLLFFPLFFVLHGVNQYNIKPLSIDILWLFLIYFGVIIGLAALCWLFFRNISKAAIAAFWLMAFNLFFGVIQDFLKEHFAKSFITKYSVVMAVFLVLFIFLFIYIRKSKGNFRKTSIYLTYLFLLLILVDAGQIIFKEIKRKADPLTKQLQPCNDCPKPDIFLVIADEYAGAQQLREQFNFDNSPFEQALRQRGFKVLSNTNANYNFTMHSMASMLNMDYMRELNGQYFRHEEAFLCRRKITKNLFMDYAKDMGYEIVNCSFFDLEGKPKPVSHYYFRDIIPFLNRQTLAGRMNFDLGHHIASSARKEAIRMNDHYNNEKALALTLQAAAMHTPKPKLVYTHLSLPHQPYYFDRHGKPMTTRGLTPKDVPRAYTEYLLYANQKFLKLVDSIKRNASTPPVIMLMSDHGFRQHSGPVPEKYYFMNLNAVHIPRSSEAFYDGMTNVNQLRALLNTLFRQQLPMLKDSTVFIKE